MTATPLHAVEDNIRSITGLERSSEAHRSVSERIADVIADFSGTMIFVGLHAAWFLLWFLINTKVLRVTKPFDPYPFILLAMIVSVEGVLLSTFVLMKQNRMQRKNDERDQLNLQIDLLSEKEITKALQLLRAISRKLEVGTGTDEELAEMAENTSVDRLAKDIQQGMRESA